MTDYIPVLCCSKSKSRKNFSYKEGTTKEDTTVHLVASPNKAPDDGTLYCTPDDQISDSSTKTWRDLVLEQDYPDLVQAYLLYDPKNRYKDIYKELHKKFDNYFYIFSAGWGIVRSTYKLPAYNITYSAQGKPWAKRTKSMPWNDFNHLRDDVKEGKISSDVEIVLFAGTGYLGPFYKLTSMIKNTKIITHMANGISKRTGYKYIPYCGTDKHTWCYQAADDFCKKGLTAPNFKK
jgi:hypothetical protein